MELALLLVMLVFAELACTVWMLARQRMYNQRASGIEKRLQGMEQHLVGGKDGKTEEPEGVTFGELLASAKHEDVEQARAILRALGIDQEG